MPQPQLNIDVIQNAIHTIADAAEDTNNALGKGTPVEKVGDFGNLIPDLVQLAGNAHVLPADLGQVPPDAVAQLSTVAQSRLGVNPQQAQTAVNGVLGILHELQGFWPIVVHGVEGLLKIGKKK